MAQTADAKVGVLGVGTMGAMTLWALARRGIRAVGIEQYSPGHDRAAAGGETRIFRVAYREGAQYVPILQESLTLWQALERQSGRHLLTLNGGLMMGPPSCDAIKNIIASVDNYDLPHEKLDKADMARRYPQHRLAEDEIAVLDKQAGFLRPELAVLSAARAAEDAGATIHRYTHIDTIEPANDHVLVHTNHGNFRFEHVIVAAGGWTRQLLPETARDVQPCRCVLTWFPATDLSQFAPERFPIFMHIASDEVDISGFPCVDGAGVKIGLNFPHDSVDAPDSYSRSVDYQSLQQTRHAISTLLNGLDPDPIRITAHMDGHTPDGHPMVGKAPGTDNITVLAGFSGHGFKMSPAIGEVAADIATEGHTIRDVAHLDPARRISEKPAAAAKAPSS